MEKKSSRKLKVMFDVMSSGLWDVQTYKMVSGSEIGLSAQLSSRIQQWNDEFERIEQEYDKEKMNKTEFLAQAKNFTEKAKELAICIKQELPQLEVAYFNEYLLRTDSNQVDGYLVYV